VATRISVKKLRSKNAAFGHRASVKDKSRTVVSGQQLTLQAEALQELRKFASLVPDYAEVVENPQNLQTLASKTEAALKKSRPRRDRIEKLISEMTMGVVGVTALAQAIEAVQAAVTRLFT
jgi:hypothetical protein